MNVLDETKEHRAGATQELQRLSRSARRVADGRLLLFIAAVGLVVAWLVGTLDVRAVWGAVIAGVGFVGLVVTHRRLDDRERRLRLEVAYDDRVLARAAGAWQGFRRDGAQYARAGHPYASDLDLFGPASLFQLLNETPTHAGEERLAAWLSAPADAETIRTRQGAVRSLAPLLAFRRELVVAAAAEGDDKVDPGQLARWASGGAGLAEVRWARWAPLVLVPATLGTYVASRSELLPSLVPLVLLLIQVLVLGLVRRPLARFFAGIAVADRALGRLRATFARLEAEDFADPHLRALRHGGTSVTASRALARLDFWYGFAEARRSQLGPVLNALFLWDLVMLFRVAAWRDVHGKHVAAWVSGLAEVEALAALAGFAAENPRSSYPEVVKGEPEVTARSLAHPLLTAAVANDVGLRGSGHALLITGSNMSGKSTLMRALGTNVVMALAGAPVIAASMRLSHLQLATCMRVEDSLARGVSFFYAEVQRLKLVLDVARDSRGACLFLLDELLLGTNTRERQLASREIVSRLLETGAVGCITTHDLELTSLERETDGRVVNAHFSDQLVDGKMSFDYTLRPGVVDTTNALRVLEMVGIPIGSSSGRTSST